MSFVSPAALPPSGETPCESIGEIPFGNVGDSLTRGHAWAGASYVVFGFDSRLKPVGKSGALSFQDVDGDVVNVKAGHGRIVPQDFVFGPDGQLQLLDLTGAADRLAGANITVGVKKGPAGNGLVDVGFIDASGIDLGTVKVTGHLGRIAVGDADIPAPRRSRASRSIRLAPWTAAARWTAPSSARSARSRSSMTSLTPASPSPAQTLPQRPRTQWRSRA